MGKLRSVKCAYCGKSLLRHNKNKRIKIEVRSLNPKGAAVEIHAGGCPK